jgi:tetratricopeptide (TPR) repeat protein
MPGIKKISPLQVLIILVFFSIIILLLFLPKSKSKEKAIINVSPIDTSLSIDLNFYAQQKKDIDSVIKLYQNKKLSIDEVITIFQKQRQPALVAYFEELKYLQSPIDTTWFYLGKNYYNALGFISNPSEADPLIASAARCFNKAILLNDKNTNARIMLASCYVQTNNPMLGVKTLKEIEKTDSNNVLLQTQLAEFSLRSNQLDKAIQRYKKALQLDSTKIEIYAYLSEIYLQKKDTLQSLYFLRKFAARISDTSLKNSINNYIFSIENHKK